MTPKQRRFVEEYLIDLNATQAAIRAGYSAKTAGQIGDENLKKPQIAAAIGKEMGARSERTQITADNVLRELARIGFSDIRKMFTPLGNLIPVVDLDDDAAAVLSSVEVVTRRAPGGDSDEVEHVAKIKVWDKQAALVNIGKHLGMFKERVEIDGHITTEPIGLSDLLGEVGRAAREGDASVN
jgi:phage terminase small subunit